MNGTDNLLWTMQETESDIGSDISSDFDTMPTEQGFVLTLKVFLQRVS